MENPSSQAGIPTTQSAIYTPELPYRLIILLLLSLLFTAIVGQIGYGHDFCPIYEGARLVYTNQSPYGPLATAYLADTCLAVATGAGTAYPLPFYFFLGPFLFLSFSTAALLWTWLGTFLSLGVFLFARQWPRILLLSICFLPVYRSIAIGQSTLIWFGIIVVLLASIHFRWWFIGGLCISVLIWKPQTSLIFVLAGLWWGLRFERRSLLVAGVSLFVTLALAYLWQPGWVRDWLAQVQVYESITPLPSLLFMLPIALIISWRFSIIVKVALIQVLLFPLTDPYSALPLLIAWIYIGGWAALIGASISYLWPFWPWDGHWMLVIGPLLLALGYKAWAPGAQVASDHMVWLHRFSPDRHSSAKSTRSERMN